MDITTPAFLLQLLQTTRYFSPRIPVPKSVHWVNEVLPNLDDDRFKVETRVSRHAFNFILNQIKDHPVFQNKDKNHQQQIPIERQLHITLYRFGRYGNGVSKTDLANHFGLGEGTVEKVTRRVITAILSLEGQYVRWYSQDEKKRDETAH